MRGRIVLVLRSNVKENSAKIWCDEVFKYVGYGIE